MRTTGLHFPVHDQRTRLVPERRVDWFLLAQRTLGRPTVLLAGGRRGVVCDDVTRGVGLSVVLGGLREESGHGRCNRGRPAASHPRRPTEATNGRDRFIERRVGRRPQRLRVSDWDLRPVLLDPTPRGRSSYRTTPQDSQTPSATPDLRVGYRPSGSRGAPVVGLLLTTH